MKWYNIHDDNSPIISCRVRLARNLKKYPFFAKLDKSQATEMINEISKTIVRENGFYFSHIGQKSDIEKLSLLEHHKISLDLLRGDNPRGLISSVDDTIHIMLNEEDHIRIQSIRPGKNVRNAFALANDTDNLIEEYFEYAFDEKYGYLTSCPSNVGTGMRASYMVHLPMLEVTGKLPRIINSLSSVGMTIRGLYGESSDPIGSIYQISNQVTLGKPEEEIISNLENITNQIVQNEMETFQSKIKKHKVFFEDQVYRAYGILTNCRQIDLKEARKHLSTMRLGRSVGLLENELPNISIYAIMMNIEYGNLKINTNSDFLDSEIDIVRASYIRKVLINPHNKGE